MSEAHGSLYFSSKTDIMIGILPGGSDAKESAGNAGELDLIPSLGGFPGDLAMATHSNTLAWRIPWTEEPGRL